MHQQKDGKGFELQLSYNYKNNYMETRNTPDVDTTKVSPVDTRRYQAQDNEGHLKGSRQEQSNEQVTEGLRKQEDSDTSEYNKLDDRSTAAGNETT